MRHKKANKTALAMSAFLFIFWILLGANATLAWFSDTTETAKNTFVIGDLNLDVSYKNGFVTDYMPMKADSKVFNEYALYEPGYTQVVWLKIENNGTVPFNYKVSVDVNDYNQSINSYGVDFCLPPHLRFGVILGNSELELNRKIAQIKADRSMGDYMTNSLNTYSVKNEAGVAPGQVRYAAVVVYMPETVGNEANYRAGADVPWVDLGMTIFAQQAGTAIN